MNHQESREAINWVQSVCPVLDSKAPALYSTIAVRFPLTEMKKMDIFQDRVAPQFKYQWGMFAQEKKHVVWFFMSSCWDKKAQQDFMNKIKETVSVGPDDLWTVDHFIITSSEITDKICQHADCHKRSKEALHAWEKHRGLDLG